VHALKDAGFPGKLSAFLRTGKPVLLTDGLAKRLAGQVKLDGPNVRLLPVKGDPKSLLQLSQKELDELRSPLLRPLNATFAAPNQVGLYLFGDGSWVIENFNREAVNVELSGQRLTIPARGWSYRWK
jgi:hypothetical protein